MTNATCMYLQIGWRERPYKLTCFSWKFFHSHSIGTRFFLPPFHLLVEKEWGAAKRFKWSWLRVNMHGKCLSPNADPASSKRLVSFAPCVLFRFYWLSSHLEGSPFLLATLPFIRYLTGFISFRTLKPVPVKTRVQKNQLCKALTTASLIYLNRWNLSRKGEINWTGK